MRLKQISIYSLALLGLSSLTGCFEAPDFPNTPMITFNKVKFVKAPSNKTNVADTLLITINYQDGDGDLGLDDNFNDITFAPILIPIKPNTDPNVRIPYRIADEGTPINIPNFDESEIPPYKGCYINTNWLKIPGKESGKFKDTIFFVGNKNAKNIFVTLLQKNLEGNFEKINWLDKLGNCTSPINGRFPVLKPVSEGTVPIEGTLTYSFRQIGIAETFKKDILKLEIYIQDRELNKSNLVITEEFTLASIEN